jgi:hypothetical protein
METIAFQSTKSLYYYTSKRYCYNSNYTIITGCYVWSHFELQQPLVLRETFWKMLAFVFLPAILGTSHCLVFVPLINIVVLLGAPMLPTQWVKLSTYFQSGPFLSITFILINLKLLIIFVHTFNVLCYVVLSYLVLVTTPHLVFVCLFLC